MILVYEANIGLIYHGPKWSCAEMVMGRNGHGPKWLWAEMTRNRRDEPIDRWGETGVPRENHLQAELVLSHIWPVRGSNLHQKQR